MGFLLKLDQSPRRTSKMNGYDRIFLGNLDIMVEPAWAIEVGNLAKPCKLCAVLTNFPTFKYNDSYLWWIALERSKRFNVTFQNELGFRISEKEGPRIWDTEREYMKWNDILYHIILAFENPVVLEIWQLVSSLGTISERGFGLC